MAMPPTLPLHVQMSGANGMRVTMTAQQFREWLANCQCTSQRPCEWCLTPPEKK